MCCRELLRTWMVVGVVLGLGYAFRPTGADTITASTPVPAVGAEGGPSRTLTPEELATWIQGRSLFDHNFGLAEGLGPDLNGDSCRACHQDPAIGGAGGLELNVSRFGFIDQSGAFQEVAGGQVGSRLRRPDIAGREEVPLPTGFPSANVFEQRQTPSIFGGGLIDAIFESEILANADPNDLDGDGIVGRARLIDVGGTFEVGRFGWKAQVPRLGDFVRDAMGGELGVTVPNNGRGFGMFTDTDPQADPELDDPQLDAITFFLSNLAPPPRGGSTEPEVAIGEMLFEQIGCARCHVPTLMSSLGPVNLYSDLLLHDVMLPTFRGMEEPDAPMGSFRTPPLWGISKTAPYLHDGRGETLADTIDQHRGEAELVRAAYLALTGFERAAVLAFLEDL